MSGRNRDRGSGRPAFTLVEVLIGVLVLALGLLGLGAIIPVVVREQRLAADVTQGRTVVNDVRTGLEQWRDFTPDEPGAVAWDYWITDKNWSGPAITGTVSPADQEYLWTVPTGVAALNLDSGDQVFTDPTTGAAPPFYLRLADRLWPTKSSQVVSQVPPGADPARPQFVWDIVGRRVEFGDRYARQYTAGQAEYDNHIGRLDVIQVAVFVRRVDLAIRVPRRPDVTLFDVLTNSRNLNAASEIRMPVAYDHLNNQLVQNSGPGSTPAGRYAEPLTLMVDTGAINSDLDDRSHIPIEGATNVNKARFLLAAQAGQKIVDNLGNVYTVRGYDENTPAGSLSELIVSPPVPSWVLAPSTGSPRSLRQVLFTPQIPVAVDVITINRPVVAP